MTYFEICLLAIALSVDAFVVSFSYGLRGNEPRTRNLLAIFTGGFQGIMPVIGYFLTTLVLDYIAPYAKFIVFFIFGYLGIKFIVEAYKPKEIKQTCIDLSCLFLIGIATSIDAFSAGISLLLSGNHIIKPAIAIGIITFINSNFGFWIGTRIKNIPSRNLEIFAGLILIILGVRALV